jgi:hypothetical protein
MRSAACWLCDEHDGTEIAIGHWRLHLRCLHVLVNLTRDRRGAGRTLTLPED